jgi:ABC-type dipeptide/oligopeptide/nickel transport system permease component
VIAVHVVKNAAIGIITLAGLEYARVFAGGAVVVETVFAYPGIGQLIILGIERRDFMLLQANVIVVVLTVLFINFAIDILYGLVNPRTRFV